MTAAETLLWRYLKAGRLSGAKFRRQVPLGTYIVDFVSHGPRLIVEVDGSSHDFVQQLERDGIRERWLNSRGYDVLRFTNEDVLGRLEGVLHTIRQHAQARLPPSPTLPRKGGGNNGTAQGGASS